MPETIEGTAGGDDLTARGNDTVRAGAGDDTIRLIDYDLGDGVFDGGTGFDSLGLQAAVMRDVREVSEDDPSLGVTARIDPFATNVATRVTLVGIEEVSLLQSDDPSGSTFYTDLVIRAGTAEDDTLEGDGFARSFVQGGAGDDLIYGNFVEGYRYTGDTLSGGSGADTLIGLGAADMRAGEGNDEIYANGPGTIDGGAGDDLIELVGEDFTVSGGQGADTLRLEGADRATLMASDVAEYDGDLIEGFAPGHRLTFNGDQDVAVLMRTAQDGADVFSVDLGGDGTIEARFTMTGLDDPSALVLVNDSGVQGSAAWSLRDATPFLIEGFEGDDDLSGFGGDDTLRGGAGDDVLDGLEGDDLIEAGDGTDQIERGFGDDTVYAGAGDDAIRLGLGDDVVFAGAGDDVVTLYTPGASSFSTATGGEGTDTLRLGVIAGWDTTVTAVDGGLTVTTDYTLFGDAQGGVRLTEFERLDLVGLFGSGGGGAPAVLILEGDLSDYLDDVTTLTHSVDTVLFDASRVVGGARFEATGGVEDDSLSGADGADSLSGGMGDDLLIGGLGADLLEGGAGADVLYGDGGAG